MVKQEFVWKILNLNGNEIKKKQNENKFTHTKL